MGLAGAGADGLSLTLGSAAWLIDGNVGPRGAKPPLLLELALEVDATGRGLALVGLDPDATGVLGEGGTALPLPLVLASASGL